MYGDEKIPLRSHDELEDWAKEEAVVFATLIEKLQEIHKRSKELRQQQQNVVYHLVRAEMHKLNVGLSIVNWYDKRYW